jgi:enoyl-CoA hydratase
VGLGSALYLIETGVVIDADHAFHIGLVQEVVAEGQALPRALELAEAISKYPRICLKNDRRATYEGLSLPLSEGIRLEAKIHESTLANPELVKGLRRYAAGKRPPLPHPPSYS